MVLAHGKTDGVDIIALSGQLNMENAGEARTALLEIIEGGCQRMVIDLGGVNFVDSSGLSVLVSAYKLIEAKAGKLVLSNIPKNVQALFALTRLNEAFHIFADTPAAVTYLTKDA